MAAEISNSHNTSFRRHTQLHIIPSDLPKLLHHILGQSLPNKVLQQLTVETARAIARGLVVTGPCENVSVMIRRFWQFA